MGMNELQVFNSPEFGELRVAEIDGVPWFVAADVCRVLDITNTTDAVSRLDEDEKSRFNLGLPGGDTNCVNEYGLYSLVLGSRKPEAKAFKRWLTHDVIPAIRKHGAYIAPNAQPQGMEAAALQAVVQPIAAALEALTGVVQAMSQRLDGLEQGRAELKALPPGGEAVSSTPGVASQRRWMRTVSEKLDLLSAKYGKSNNAILHKIYKDIEEEFETVMEDERYRVMEEQGLEKCSVLTAIFFDEELRDYFQQYVDYNLAPENRGW